MDHRFRHHLCDCLVQQFLVRGHQLAGGRRLRPPLRLTQDVLRPSGLSLHLDLHLLTRPLLGRGQGDLQHPMLVIRLDLLRLYPLGQRNRAREFPIGHLRFPWRNRAAPRSRFSFLVLSVGISSYFREPAAIEMRRCKTKQKEKDDCLLALFLPIITVKKQ